MQKCMLLALLMSSALSFSATEGQNTSSCASAIMSGVSVRLLGGAVLAGAGIFGLYKLMTHFIYKEEERIFNEHAQELEPQSVTRKDFGMICDLIDAMEQDIAQFVDQPSCVKSLEFIGFDDEKMEDGCKGMREIFCTLYEQCIQEPENKAFLEEIIMIFKQTVEEGMVVA